MTFMDKLKRRAEELDLQGKADQLADAASKAAHQAKDKAAELANDNRAKIGSTLDKAGAAIDKQTDGKYADKVAKAKQQVSKSVDKLAEQRPAGNAGTVAPFDAPPADAPAAPRFDPRPSDAPRDAPRFDAPTPDPSPPTPPTDPSH